MAEPRGGAKKRRGGRKRARRERPRVETSAGGVVFRRSGESVQYLLIRDPYKNWGLPKGHLEAGETPRVAAEREVREETGLDDAAAVAELQTIDWYFRDRGRLVHKFCHFFLVESAAGEARPQTDEGITACVWLPFAEAERKLTYDNARAVLREAGRILGDAP